MLSTPGDEELWELVSASTIDFLSYITLLWHIALLWLLSTPGNEELWELVSASTIDFLLYIYKTFPGIYLYSASFRTKLKEGWIEQLYRSRLLGLLSQGVPPWLTSEQNLRFSRIQGRLKVAASISDHVLTFYWLVFPSSGTLVGYLSMKKFNIEGKLPLIRYYIHRYVRYEKHISFIFQIILLSLSRKIEKL